MDLEFRVLKCSTNEMEKFLKEFGMLFNFKGQNEMGEKRVGKVK